MSHVAVVVVALSACVTAWALPQGTEADRAKADALRALKSAPDDRPVSQDLERSRQKWPAYDREIEAGILDQQKSLDEGGRAAEDLLVLFRDRAKIQETPAALYLYGRFLGVLDRVDEASSQFEAALRLDPYFPWAHHGLATSFARRSKFADAVRAYRRALELNPSFLRSMEPLAACLIQIDQFDDAERTLRKLIEVSPSDHQAYMTLGKLLAQRTRFADAASAFRTALRLKPGHEEARRLLAYCLRRAGQPEESKKIYAEILGENPNEFSAHLGLAEALYLLGENHAAADAYEGALKHWPANADSRGREEILGRIPDLRKLPPVEKRDPRTKSPHEWVEILVNSTEPERCLEAIRVLSTINFYDAEVYKAFLQALKNKHPPVRVLAIKALAAGYEGNLPELTPLLSLFVVEDSDRLCRAMAARVLGIGRDQASVPALVKALKDRDAYVFREVHDALWVVTSSDVPAMLPRDLTPEAMESTAKAWNAWYDENRDRYRKYEPAPK